MKLITANKLNRMWNRGFLPKLNLKIDKTKVLTTVEQVSANTNAENIAGATVAKELINNLMFPDGVRFYPDKQGDDYGFNIDAQRGADTFRPFNKKLKYKVGEYTLTGTSKTHTDTVDGEIIAVVTLATSGASITGGAWIKDADYNVNDLHAIQSINESTVTFKYWSSNTHSFKYCIIYI